jgi:hypothetical protein
MQRNWKIKRRIAMHALQGSWVLLVVNGYWLLVIGYWLLVIGE